MSMYDIVIGYDIESDCVAEITMDAGIYIHGAVVGSSGSGKSVALLWLLYQLLSCDAPLELFISDSKNSGDFNGIVPPCHFANNLMDSVALIHKYYNEVFQNASENSDKLRLLIIDEYASLVLNLENTIEGKAGKLEVEKIKSEISIILMLGRSRKTGLWVSAQRPNAGLVASSSGSWDNLMFVLNMGKLYTQTHALLFSNECLENEEFAKTFRPGRGEGYFLRDGNPLKAVKIPLVRDKAALRSLLQRKYREKFNNI